jgi:hypothetical protein
MRIKGIGFDVSNVLDKNFYEILLLGTEIPFHLDRLVPKIDRLRV